MSDPAVIARAREVERKHQEILNALAEAQSPERMRELAGMLSVVKREYVARELVNFQVLMPSALDPLNPAHAVVIAVRGDMDHTIRLIDGRLSQQRLWEATKSSPAWSPTGGGGSGDFWKQLKEILDSLGTVGKVGIAAAVLYLVWGLRRR